MKTAEQKVFTYEHDFPAFVAFRDGGQVSEIDEEMFYYWLEVLPPTGFNGKQGNEAMRMSGMSGDWLRPDGQIQRFSFAFAEGWEPITVFWHFGGKFYAQRTGIVNRR